MIGGKDNNRGKKSREMRESREPGGKKGEIPAEMAVFEDNNATVHDIFERGDPIIACIHFAQVKKNLPYDVINMTNEHGHTVLQRACYVNNHPLVAALIKGQTNLDVNFRFVRDKIPQYTALNIACFRKNIQCVEELLKSPKLKLLDDWQAAVKYDSLNYKMSKLLFAHKFADINENYGSLTPLFYTCAETGDKLTQLTQILLDNPKVDPNARIESGDFPLHVAVRENNIETVKILLKCAKVNRKLKFRDLTPLEFAHESYSREIVDLF